MPGIETAAPERTDTSSGRSGSPSFDSVVRSTSARAASISGQSHSGSTTPDAAEAPLVPAPGLLAVCVTWAQTSVVMVNPGGTGSPA